MGSKRSESQGWKALDDRLRRIEASPHTISLLASLSLEGGESAWTKPAMLSLYEGQGDARTPELFFAELKELTLAVRSVEVEQRYAPWAPTTAIADLPASTLAPEAHATPALWFARWVGVAQRLGPMWPKVRGMLRDLADEAPVVSDDDEQGESRADTPLRSFLTMLEAIVESLPGRIEAPAPRLEPPRSADLREWEELVQTVPFGPLEPALRGRTISFPDGVELRFLRYPRMGELSWADGGSRLSFLAGGDPEIPAPIASTLGAYVSAARPALEAEVTGFVERCERAFGRFREAFAPELVARALAPTNVGRDGWK
ncbi:MAG: hypothetical protein L3K19_06310 [Thermoplasmata archaeon]|nr:hypothetical protein [Thermoplasmata archaeon]